MRPIAFAPAVEPRRVAGLLPGQITTPLWEFGPLQCVLVEHEPAPAMVQVLYQLRPICSEDLRSGDDAIAVAERLRDIFVAE